MALDPIENHAFFPRNGSILKNGVEENDFDRKFNKKIDNQKELSLIECIDEFLNAVNHMDSSILYKSRLVEIEIDPKMEEYLSKVCSFTRIPISSFETTTLQPYYSMVKDFKDSIQGGEGTEVPIKPNIIKTYNYFEKGSKSSSEKVKKNSVVESCYKSFDFISGKFKLLIKTFTDLAKYITRKYEQHLFNLQKSITTLSYQTQP